MLKFVLLALSLAILYGCSSVYSGLTAKQSGVNIDYYPAKETTSELIKLGEQAIDSIQSECTDSEYCTHMKDIVASKILIGKNKSEIGKIFRLSKKVYNVQPEMTHIGYSCCEGESSCDLIIIFNKEGIVTEAYLSINH